MTTGAEPQRRAARHRADVEKLLADARNAGELGTIWAYTRTVMTNSTLRDPVVASAWLAYVYSLCEACQAAMK